MKVIPIFIEAGISGFESPENSTGISTLVNMHFKSNECVPIKDVWQTDPIVKKVLELAYDSSAFAREFFLKQIDDQLSKGQIAKICPPNYKNR